MVDFQKVQRGFEDLHVQLPNDCTVSAISKDRLDTSSAKHRSRLRFCKTRSSTDGEVPRMSFSSSTVRTRSAAADGEVPQRSFSSSTVRTRISTKTESLFAMLSQSSLAFGKTASSSAEFSKPGTGGTKTRRKLPGRDSPAVLVRTITPCARRIGTRLALTPQTSPFSLSSYSSEGRNDSYPNSPGRTWSEPQLEPCWVSMDEIPLIRPGTST